jgi:hypothetical protein
MVTWIGPGWPGFRRGFRPRLAGDRIWAGRRAVADPGPALDLIAASLRSPWRPGAGAGMDYSALVHTRRVTVTRARPVFPVPWRSFRCNVETGQYRGSAAVTNDKGPADHVQTFCLRY